MPADATAEPCERGSCWEYTLHVPHDARAVGIARSTLHAVLVRHGLAQLLDTALLLATELLTNAYLHSDGPASLRLRWRSGTLRIGVWDTDPTPPSKEIHVAGTNEESGRGLLLVRVCADEWGWFLLGDDIFGARGKFVWCELGTNPRPERWDIAA